MSAGSAVKAAACRCQSSGLCQERGRRASVEESVWQRVHKGRGRRGRGREQGARRGVQQSEAGARVKWGQRGPSPLTRRPLQHGGLGAPGAAPGLALKVSPRCRGPCPRLTLPSQQHWAPLALSRYCFCTGCSPAGGPLPPHSHQTSPGHPRPVLSPGPRGRADAVQTSP